MSKRHAHSFDDLPACGYARLADLLSPGPLPVSADTLLRMVKAGEFPAPTRISAGVLAWNVGEVRGWLAERRKAS